MWICGNCGTQNDDGDGIFCAACGTARPPESGHAVRLCPHCGAQNDDDDIFCAACGAACTPESGHTIRLCPHCGAQINGDDIFCAACGAACAPESGHTVRLCPYCDAEIPDASAVCPVCGAALLPTSDTSAASAQFGSAQASPVPPPRRFNRAVGTDAGETVDPPRPVRSESKTAGKRIDPQSDPSGRADAGGQKYTRSNDMIRFAAPNDADQQSAAGSGDDEWLIEPTAGKSGTNLSRRILPFVFVIAACMVGIMLFVFALRWQPGGNTSGNSAADASTTAPSIDGSAFPETTATTEPAAATEPAAVPSPSPTPAPTPTPTQHPTPTPTQQPTATPLTAASALEAFVLEGAERDYSMSELTPLSQYQLMILRNGMFAISGKRFSHNQEVIDFFSACDWYVPLYDSDTETRAHMNDFQKNNLERIIAVEKDKGYR